MDNESSNQHEESQDRTSGIRNELRTIAFRLREMQRLQSIRLEQENRRLEAAGLEPVTDAGFFKRTERPREIAHETIAQLVEKLGDVTVDDHVRVSLIDGTQIEGHAGPVDYDPTNRLHMELTPTHDTRFRYELRTSRENDGWNQIRVRKYETGDEEWTALAQVADVSLDVTP